MKEENFFTLLLFFIVAFVTAVLLGIDALQALYFKDMAVMLNTSPKLQLVIAGGILLFGTAVFLISFFWRVPPGPRPPSSSSR